MSAPRKPGCPGVDRPRLAPEGAVASKRATLLDQLIDAMDAADEYNAGKRERVEIVLRRGAMVARAIAIDIEGRVEIKPLVAERMIGLDMLELAHWPGAARDIVEQAVAAL